MDHSKIINDTLFIKSENKIVKIQLGDIYFIEAIQSEIVIYTNSSTYKLHCSINEIRKSVTQQR